MTENPKCGTTHYEGCACHEARHQAIRDAAQAVVDRWDTPLWKDAPATAEYINKLRNALQ